MCRIVDIGESVIWDVSAGKEMAWNGVMSSDLPDFLQMEAIFSDRNSKKWKI